MEQQASNAICHAAEMAKIDIQFAASQYMRPSAIWRPKISVDGNKWCALYGDNLQDGLAGFGDSVAEAMADFDLNWTKHLPIQKGNGLNELSQARTETTLSEIAAERARQVTKWGNAHDDGHSNLDFARFINIRVGRSHDDALTRRMMVEIAALAVANIERIDRAAA